MMNDVKAIGLQSVGSFIYVFILILWVSFLFFINTMVGRK